MLTQSFHYSGETDEKMFLSDIDKNNTHFLQDKQENALTLLWFTSPGNALLIDGIKHYFKPNDILCLTEFHKVEVIKMNEAKMFRFNKSFYCILDHDSEVGCKGVLFFGAANLPIISISDSELEKFEILYKMLVLEFQARDNLQLEMLQMMVKRLLILCTRLYKEQNDLPIKDPSQADLIREFNYLVESHFRTKHSVSEYAELMFKSPKTLANFFSKNYSKSPIQIIQERILIEARRLLIYSDSSISDITYDLGFDNIQSFSRFFKSKQGQSPTQYRENGLKTRIV